MVVGPVRLNGQKATGTPLMRERAYEAIRAAIERLDLAPSSMIDEADLCKQLELGRTPVHDALQRLHHEGLVKMFPRRGMMVAPLDLLEWQHLTQTRTMWEPNVARLAAHVGSAATWDALEAVLDETPTTFATIEDAAVAVGVNRRFHCGIAEATGNPCIVQLAEQHNLKQARLSFAFFRHGLYSPVETGHREILAALRTGEGEHAATLMTEHIDKSARKIKHVRSQSDATG